MINNQHSDSIVTLWYLSEPKIRKLVGVPFRSNSGSFDFEIINNKHDACDNKHRIVQLDRKNVLFICPRGIKRVTKRQFMNLFEILKIGKIKSAFPPEIILEFEKHISELPSDLRNFFASSLAGEKNINPAFNREFMDILKAWCEYVVSKTH